MAGMVAQAKVAAQPGTLSDARYSGRGSVSVFAGTPLLQTGRVLIKIRGQHVRCYPEAGMMRRVSDVR
jgi:hypothetical protein